MTRDRLLLVVAACAALWAGCDSSANKATGASEVEPVVLTLANWEFNDAGVGEWAQAVERLSRGAIRIDIRGHWRRGEVETDRGTLNDVRAGRVDIGHIATRAWDTLGVDSFQALDAPLLIDSLALERRVITSELGQTCWQASRQRVSSRWRCSPVRCGDRSASPVICTARGPTAAR